MAFSLSSIGQAVNTGLSNLTRSLSTDPGNALNSSLRGLSTSLNSINTSNLQSSLRNVSANLNNINLGGAQEKITSVLNSGELQGALSRVSGLTSTLGGATNNIQIGQILDSKLGNLGFTAFSSNAISVSRLGSIGQTFAESISTLNPVTVLNRSIQEISGAVGGEFEAARRYIDALPKDTTSFFGSIDPWAVFGPGGEFDTTGSSSSLGSSATESSTRLLNPLRNFNHFNTIFTLGILDAGQFNSPDSYRNANGFKRVIIKSGGGERQNGYANRVRTAAELGSETTAAGDAEYFIDNVEITAVVAPNSNTGTTLGTNVTFNVVEPFSMGKFIEAMMLGAVQAGFSNYIDAPFCLKIEFCGWDERGERDYTAVNPFYVPIKLTKVEFDVGKEGSTYAVKAVPYNEAGLTDEANEAKTPVNARGSNVHEVLETGSNAVTSILNSRIEELENRQVIAGYDRYLVVFPKNKEDLLNAVRGQNVDVSTLRSTVDADIQERIRRGTSTVTPSSDPDTPRVTVQRIYPSAPDTYLYLKAYAQDTNNMNEIGRSILIEDSRDGSPQPHPDAAGVQDANTQTNRRQNSESQPAEKSRSYQFNQGDKVTSMIESVLMNSDYARTVVREPSQNGFKKWFRIETMVFVEPGGNTEQIMGRPRRTYVYSVQPFYPHEAKFLGSGERPNGIRQLKSKIKKEYNYFYTGKNEDVLNFNINFNNAFFNNLRPDMGQGRESVANETTASGQQSGSQVASSRTSSTAATNNEAAAGVGMSDAAPRSSGGLPRTTATGTETRIAEMFHDRLVNGQVDMITAEMEIWGDPYFIPTDLGNYSSTPASPGVSADGAMSYMRDEVYVLVNFRTPLDYIINGSTMDFPAHVKPFSGIYQVMSVTNTFNNGQFTQTLKMVRMRGQNDEGTTGNTTPIQVAPRETRLDSGGSAANLPANPQATSTISRSSSPTTEVVRVANPVTSGPNVVYTQELIMTGQVSPGLREFVNSPYQTVESVLRDNPELRQFVGLNSADRTAFVRDPRQGVFPRNTASAAAASAASAAEAAASAAVQFRSREAALAGLPPVTETAQRSTALGSTGTRPPVNRNVVFSRNRGPF